MRSDSETDGLYTNGWEVKVTASGQTTSTTYNTETLTISMPEGSHVVISPILGTEPNAVGQLDADIDPALPCDIYDTTGRHLGTTSTFNSSPLTLPQGIYILRQGNATKKISGNHITHR